MHEGLHCSVSLLILLAIWVRNCISLKFQSSSQQAGDVGDRFRFLTGPFSCVLRETAIEIIGNIFGLYIIFILLLKFEYFVCFKNKI